MSLLIAGYDGSPGAAAALAFCRGLSETAGRITAVNVVEDAAQRWHAGPLDAGADPEQHRRSAEELLDGAAADRYEVVVAGSPARGLHDAAAVAGADLLAIGASHHGRFARMRPGSVADGLLQGAPCSVAIVPPNMDALPTRVTIAYDGSPEAEIALRSGADLARRLGARVRILGVREPASVVSRRALASGAATRPIDGVAVRLLERARETFGAEAETLLVSGAAGRAILDELTPGEDLLVLGSRGYGPVLGVALGSVARFAVAHAPCPALVTPRSLALGAADAVRVADAVSAGGLRSLSM